MEEVPVQLKFSQVKHFVCFLKTSISYPNFLKAWNGTRRFNVFYFVPFSAEIRGSRSSHIYIRWCFCPRLPCFLNLFSFWNLLSCPSSRWHLRGQYTISQFFKGRSKQLSHVCTQSLVYRILLFWICMCHIFSSHHQFKQRFKNQISIVKYWCSA